MRYSFKEYLPIQTLIFILLFILGASKSTFGSTPHEAIEGEVFSPPYSKVWVLRGLQRSGTNLIQQSIDCILGKNGVQAYQPLMEAIWRPRMKAKGHGSYLHWYGGKITSVPFFLQEDFRFGKPFDISVPPVIHHPLWKHHLPYTTQYCPINTARHSVWKKQCYHNSNFTISELDSAIKHISGYPWGFLFPPNFTYVVAVKSPLHWLASILKHKDILNSEFEPKDRNPHSLLLIWTQYYLWWITQESSYAKKMVWIKYEDMLFEREETLSRLCEDFGFGLTFKWNQECAIPKDVRMSQHADFRLYQQKFTETACWEGVSVPANLLGQVKNLNIQALGPNFRHVVDHLGYSCSSQVKMIEKPPLKKAGKGSSNVEIVKQTIVKDKTDFWFETLNLHRTGPVLDCSDNTLGILRDAFVLGLFSPFQFSGLQYFYWDDIALGKMVRQDFPEYTAILNIKPEVRMWDFTRLLVVYKYGGLYLDLDYLLHKPWRDFVVDKNKANYNFVVEDFHNKFQNSAFLFPKESHELKSIIQESWSRIISQQTKKKTTQITHYTTDVFDLFLNSTNTVMLPNNLFNPSRRSEHHISWCFLDVYSQQMSTWSWVKNVGNRNELVALMTSSCTKRLNKSMVQIRHVVRDYLCKEKKIIF